MPGASCYVVRAEGQIGAASLGVTKTMAGHRHSIAHRETGGELEGPRV